MVYEDPATPFRRAREELRDDDPSVLQSYLHSSKADTQRMSSSELKALRGSTQKGSPFLMRAIFGSLGKIWSGFQGLFSGPIKARPKCMNGHTPPASWGDGYPKCIDCGIEIQTPEDLKGSAKFR